MFGRQSYYSLNLFSVYLLQFSSIYGGLAFCCLTMLRILVIFIRTIKFKVCPLKNIRYAKCLHSVAFAVVFGILLPVSLH